MPYYGAEANRDERDLPSSDADSRATAVTKPLHSSNSRASSRAPKRIKRPQDPKTPATCAANYVKPTTILKEHWGSTMRIGRIPLADLGSTQGPGPLKARNPTSREHQTSGIDGAGEVAIGKDRESQIPGSDDESFSGGDLFTSTNQQGLASLGNDSPRRYYDETTIES